MTVNFDHRPGAPGGLTATASNAAPAGCASGSARPALATTTPTFNAVLTDPDSQDSLYARWEWQAVDGSQHATVSPSDSHPGGVNQSISVPSGTPLSATPGIVYEWRVHAFDGALDGPSSPWCEFTIDRSAPGRYTVEASAAGERDNHQVTVR
jgi:hypothetical protein